MISEWNLMQFDIRETAGEMEAERLLLLADHKAIKSRIKKVEEERRNEEDGQSEDL